MPKTKNKQSNKQKQNVVVNVQVGDSARRKKGKSSSHRRRQASQQQVVQGGARGGASGGASSCAVAGAPASIVFNGMPMQNQPSPYQPFQSEPMNVNQVNREVQRGNFLHDLKKEYSTLSSQHEKSHV
jgi:hypothetical protein